MPFTLDSITDLDAVRQRRARAAAQAAAAFSCRRGLAYGPLPAQTLDLYPATTLSGPAPVLLFIHGGFWRSMRAAEFAFLAPGFVPHGVALALLDYPMIPAVRMKDIVDACRLALRYLHRQGGSLGLDPGRIFVAGNSAGGHLVAELMDAAWMEQAQLPGDVLRGGVAISGLYDLAPVSASFQNDTLQLTVQEIADFSPLMRPLVIRAPLIVAVGADETGEFLRQSAAFAAHTRAAGTPTLHSELPGTNHVTVVLDAFADPEHALNRATRDLIAAGSLP